MIEHGQGFTIREAEVIGYAVETLAQSFSELAPEHLFTGAQAAEMLRLLSSTWLAKVTIAKATSA